MTSKRGAQRGSRKSVELAAEEEKALRMNKGLKAPDDLVLEMRGKEHAETWARLREIENRAFQMSGRLDALKKEAALEEEEASAKKKIVAKLREKSGGRGETVEVSAKKGQGSRKSTPRR